MTDFVNQKICVENGFHDKSSGEFVKENKRYYQEVEDYDWVEVVDRLRGPEAILHRLRERQALTLLKKFNSGSKILDAGCGTGLVLRHLPAGSVGLDINPRNIKKAKLHAPKAEVILGDIEKLPFPNSSFKTIISMDVLEHLIEPKGAIFELFRVLSPGGILIGSVPAQNLIWRLRFLSSTHPGEPYHKLYKKKEIETLFSGKGKLLEIKRGCLFMNFFFVVKKT